jgi:3-phenylpropionate/cinnamic acid dioxygenase small subunit
LAGVDGESLTATNGRSLMSAYQDLSLQERMLLKFEAEEFLYYEADLLDSRRFDEWLNLLADDIHYWMPLRRTTQAKEVEKEFTAPGGMALFDDDKTILTMRIQRLAIGRAWAEDPPSRTRRLISNVRIDSIDEDELTVRSNFKLYRTRLNSEEDSWIGRREDTLRRSEGGFLLCRRHLFLEQTVILSQNLSSLF